MVKLVAAINSSTSALTSLQGNHSEVAGRTLALLASLAEVSLGWRPAGA